ncbi:MAG: hypothetical protein EA355_03505 [Rhodobacteraceae bacterium]|nr:MAG: hypothetical protein EA355_03505 [Paracoccaceae bacterium]
MRKALFAAGLACLAAACGGRQAAAPQPSAFMATRDDSCYTVDLFSPAPVIAPGAEVPDNWRAFSGRWGGGAWDGEWCHDLHILSIDPSGEVVLIETHAPHDAWGKPATAFRRKARIDRDGRLRMAYGRTEIAYWYENGLLFGVREEGGGERRIALARRGA